MPTSKASRSAVTSSLYWQELSLAEASRWLSKRMCRAKFRIFSAGSEEPACSVDLTSCLDGWLMTASSENVFAPQSSQQGWQRTHLLIVGGVGTHTRWTATKNFVSSGRAE